MTFRRCSKCGNMYVSPEYNSMADMLFYLCNVCGYQWSEKPVDRFYEKEEQNQ